MTWEEFKQVRSYRTGQGEIFINVNRRSQIFIRARRGVDDTKTFNFSARGFGQAMQWLKG